MKRIICTLFLGLTFWQMSFGQNSPFYIWGTGLNGSTYQKSAIYTDIDNGLLIEAPLSPTNEKLPIELNWRGSGDPALFITKDSKIGIGTKNPHQKLTIANGGISLTHYAYTIAVASPSSGRTTFARLLGTDIARSVDRASLTTNGYVNTNTGQIIQDNPNLPTWALTLDANNDIFSVKRAFAGGNSWFPLLTVKHTGTTAETLTSTLTVAGGIRAREIKVEANAGADFVFAPDYHLRSLTEVELFITTNKHLPDIVPADSMVQNGVDVGEFQIKLLQKIEELTLYVIELKKENKIQQESIDRQNTFIRELEQKIISQ